MKCFYFDVECPIDAEEPIYCRNCPLYPYTAIKEKQKEMKELRRKRPPEEVGRKRRSKKKEVFTGGKRTG